MGKGNEEFKIEQVTILSTIVRGGEREVERRIVLFLPGHRRVSILIRTIAVTIRDEERNGNGKFSDWVSKAKIAMTLSRTAREEGYLCREILPEGENEVSLKNVLDIVLPWADFNSLTPYFAVIKNAIEYLWTKS